MIPSGKILKYILYHYIYICLQVVSYRIVYYRVSTLFATAHDELLQLTPNGHPHRRRERANVGTVQQDGPDVFPTVAVAHPWEGVDVLESLDITDFGLFVVVVIMDDEVRDGAGDTLLCIVHDPAVVERVLWIPGVRHLVLTFAIAGLLP